MPLGRARAAFLRVIPQPAQVWTVIALIALGVALASGAMLATSAIGDGMGQSINALAGLAEVQVVGRASGAFAEIDLGGVKATPGVRAAAPLLLGAVFVEGGDGDSIQIIGVDMLDDSTVRLYEPTAGSQGILDDPLIFLSQPDSIMASRTFAERFGIEKGQSVAIDGALGVGKLALRAVLEDEGVAAAFGGNIVVMDLISAQNLLGLPGQVSQVDIALEDGADATAIAELIRSELPSHLKAGLMADRRREAVEATSGYRVLLDSISLMGLILAAVVTANRLSAVYQSRLTEFGVARGLGWSAAELVRALLLEAMALSLVGVLIGLPLGYAVAQLLVAPLSDSMAMNFKLAIFAPDAGLSPRPLLVAALAGVASGVFGASIPAIRVARHRIHELLEGNSRRASVARRRWVAPLRVLLPILAVVLTRMVSVEPSPALAALAIVVAIAAGAALISPAERLSGWVLGRVFGVSAEIGLVDQSTPPSRVTGSVVVLMVGVAVVTLLMTMASSFQVFVVENLIGIRRSDLIVESRHDVGAPGADKQRLSDALVSELAEIPGVQAVGAGVNIVSGEPARGIVAIDPIRFRLPEFADWALTPESQADALEAVASGRAALITPELEQNAGVRVGDSISVVTPTGDLSMPIVGVLRAFPISASGDIILSRDVYRQHWGDQTITRAFVLVDEAASVGGVQAAIQSTLGEQYPIQVITPRGLRDWWSAGIRRGFAFSNVVTVLMLAFALLGIGDALYADTLERTRDIGTMRAIGFSAADMRHMVLVQALSIGVVGVSLGLAVGSAISIAFVRGVTQAAVGWDVVLIFDAWTPLQVAVLGIGACLLGSVWPAVRASRMPVVDALRYE